MSEQRFSIRKAMLVAVLSTMATLQAVANSAKAALDAATAALTGANVQNEAADAALADLRGKYEAAQQELATTQEKLAQFQDEEKVEDHPEILSQIAALGVTEGTVTTPAAADTPAPPGDMTPVTATEETPPANP